ncbi:MAG: tRNA (adenosine(37)-N6)-dimethylallyltransferase MiaA [Candidatus Magasanikbacteria bacterium RIFOXYD2_FULL_39_9]|uniref:tRNA dimethylallyltransferase n=1 Tax=Candidatus Magasanikbacteria bacterium RIFOXYD1_FULL_40_23 TaxID=1798705 RepID=A0A1F6PA89_9BACT|nr:MAG: tRNA (adenosine(37)-N6)-dimethylallyltransferase MiaA [Candidatus Magasanikbacteria bacterium RIFOXYD2_FULL_39_9]OGH93095.1 MAG: tRNA (adenosine(37)-N6)-dimethylallyltransferase MiaA [Candidatus Magasanikbacteria bacterium RIFOXYD1_FULL_40_23]
MQNNLPKIAVILGPTASGKTDLGLVLAKQFNGEIISADSRQVYKKMDIGTAKPRGEWKKEVFLVEGVPHHIVDIANPGQDFSLADFKAMATDCIQDILARNKLPIIVGGTGLYIWAIVDNLDIPKTKPNLELRSDLEKKDLSELVAMLQERDPESVEKIDLKNPRRVLRALEVAISSGQSFVSQRTQSKPLYNALQIGIDINKEELDKRIDSRVDRQIKDGLVEEAKKLVELGLGWNLPSMSGIGYKQIGYYLRGEMTLEEAVEVLKRDTKRYAKRQMTWFKRDKRIKWIKNTDLDLAKSVFEEFLNR